MNRLTLKQLMFMAICCDIGLFSKKLIGPFANIFTDALHIPGGIGTSFSIMFIVMAALLVNKVGCATLMCIVQAVVALSLGMTGSMGALSPIGYVVPGLVIDLILYASQHLSITDDEKGPLMNSLAAVSASLTANLIVFHLSGIVLLLYCSVAFFSGLLCGILGDHLVTRINKIVRFN